MTIGTPLWDEFVASLKEVKVTVEDRNKVRNKIKTLPFYDYLISIWSLIVLFEY